MTMIDPRHTLGRLAVDRDQLLRTLAAEGLLERNRSRTLAPVPLRLGLITSDGSAAAHDMLAGLERSGLGWQVSLIDTRVQGVDAVDEILAALRVAARLELDAVALIRGGGGRSDLVAFDHESVARAIATMPIPVITGIGHEIDDSVADRVAYRSFTSPTACASFLCDTVTAYQDRVDHLWSALSTRSLDVLDRQDARVQAAAARVRSGARTTLELGTARIVELRAAMTREPDRALDRAGRQVDALHRHVGALDPVRVLARGWSITRTGDGSLVRGVGDVAAGTTLLTRTHDGTIASTVDTTTTDPSPAEPNTT